MSFHDYPDIGVSEKKQKKEWEVNKNLCQTNLPFFKPITFSLVTCLGDVIL